MSISQVTDGWQNWTNVADQHIVALGLFDARLQQEADQEIGPRVRIFAIPEVIARHGENFVDLFFAQDYGQGGARRLLDDRLGGIGAQNTDAMNPGKEDLERGNAAREGLCAAAFAAAVLHPVEKLV